MQFERGKYLLAEDLLSKALAMDPNNTTALNQYSFVLAAVGRLKEALELTQRIRALEPLLGALDTGVAELLWLNGQTGAAIALLEKLPSDYVTRWYDLAMIYAAMGRYTEAADALQTLVSLGNSGSLRPEMLAASVRLLRTAPAIAASPESLPRLGRLGFVYVHVGAPGRYLEFYGDMVAAGFLASGGTDNALLWHPSYAALRKTERFKNWVRSVGLVDYWRERGWPNRCRPAGADDFVCT
jgi:tetratricopeptide (TPR) repeat protein